jgi:hypothetical protein
MSALIHHRYDLNPTFDVAVGAKTFSLHTSVFTERSEFFRAARKPEWLAGTPKKPVDLRDEDTNVFNEYMNCVYFGQDTLKHYADDVNSCSAADPDSRLSSADDGFRALIHLYLLADRLQDIATANMIIDEIIQYSDIVRAAPGSQNYDHIYKHTAPHNPLRILMRDYFLHETSPTDERAVKGLPPELMTDVLLEFMRIKDQHWDSGVQDAFAHDLSDHTKKDKCYYHQHDDKHPRCVAEP